MYFFSASECVKCNECVTYDLAHLGLEISDRHARSIMPMWNATDTRSHSATNGKRPTETDALPTQ